MGVAGSQWPKVGRSGCTRGSWAASAGGSELHVSAAPHPLRSRVVAAVVPTPRFLAEERRLDNESTGLDEVLLFRCPFREPLLDLLEGRPTDAQSLRGARDPGVLPHHGAHAVGC